MHYAAASVAYRKWRNPGKADNAVRPAAAGAGKAVPAVISLARCSRSGRRRSRIVGIAAPRAAVQTDLL